VIASGAPVAPNDRTHRRKDDVMSHDEERREPSPNPQEPTPAHPTPTADDQDVDDPEKDAREGDGNSSG
jgi:hypothetical protein